MTRHTVTTTAEIRTANDDIGGRAAEMVRLLLNKHDTGVVFWIPEWLADETGAEYDEGFDQVQHGIVCDETDKGLRIGDEQSAEWLPKSQVVVFDTREDTTVESNQETLL